MQDEAVTSVSYVPAASGQRLRAGAAGVHAASDDSTHRQMTCEDVETEHSAAKAAPASKLLLALIILLLIKLILIAGREIVPERDDSIGYVRISTEYLSSMLSGTASHPPVASLVIAASRLFGMP